MRRQLKALGIGQIGVKHGGDFLHADVEASQSCTAIPAAPAGAAPIVISWTRNEIESEDTIGFERDRVPAR